MVDEITPGALPSLGVIEAQTTNFGGHPPEFCVMEQSRLYQDVWCRFYLYRQLIFCRIR